MFDFLFRALDWVVFHGERRRQEAEKRRQAEIDASDRAIREELEAADRRRRAAARDPMGPS